MGATDFSDTDISIHAAREGGDALDFFTSGINAISIHAAREGGDGITGVTTLKICNFNPRRP